MSPVAGAADGEARSGIGWRPTKISGRPSSWPSTRTSFLNNSRKGSTSFMFVRAGGPPTRGEGRQPGGVRLDVKTAGND
jgi:hypothetical protein